MRNFFQDSVPRFFANYEQIIFIEYFAESLTVVCSNTLECSMCKSHVAYKFDQAELIWLKKAVVSGNDDDVV